MFAKFILKLPEGNLNDEYKQYIIEQKRITEEKTHIIIDQYLLNDGTLDASAMESDWFPEVDADIFLSHSHADEKAIIDIAGFLFKECGLKCFIDSMVWGYADNLLKQIDEKYCIKSRDEKGNKMYSYENRNRTTAQVHLMLQGALAKMIDRCECLVFVNTPQSLKMSDVQVDSMTASPWIYSELLMANTFPIRPLNEYRITEMSHFCAEVSYKVNLTSFVDISLDEFLKAKEKVGIFAPHRILDQLYLDKGVLIK